MLMVSSNSASISVRRRLDFCTMRAAKFFALQSEQVRALGLSLLHLGSLHHVGITVAVGVEPANEQTAAESLTAVARFADVEQYVGVGGEECLDDQENGLAEFLVKWRGLMALVADCELIGTRRPDGIVVHKTDVEDLSPAGFHIVVTPVISPHLVWGQRLISDRSSAFILRSDA